MGFKKPINMEQSIYSMSGFTGNKGCSEGQKGSGMKTIVFQERTEFGYLHLLLIFAQPPGKPSCTSQRCCCPRLPGKFQFIHTKSTEV